MTTGEHPVQTGAERWRDSREMSPRKWAKERAEGRILINLDLHKIFTILMENLVKISDDRNLSKEKNNYRKTEQKTEMQSIIYIWAGNILT